MLRKLWRQTGKQYTVTGKMLSAVACDQRWPDVVAGISALFSKFAFVLFCCITNHLMTGPLGNSEFCFLWISVFLLTSSWETLRFLGNKIHCSPQDQSLSVNYTTTSVLVLSWTWFGWKVQEWHGEYDCEIENCLIRCAFWIADIYVQCDYFFFLVSSFQPIWLHLQQSVDSVLRVLVKGHMLVN